MRPSPSWQHTHTHTEYVKVQISIHDPSESHVPLSLKTELKRTFSLVFRWCNDSSVVFIYHKHSFGGVFLEVSSQSSLVSEWIKGILTVCVRTDFKTILPFSPLFCFNIDQSYLTDSEKHSRTYCTPCHCLSQLFLLAIIAFLYTVNKYWHCDFFLTKIEKEGFFHDTNFFNLDYL